MKPNLFALILVVLQASPLLAQPEAPNFKLAIKLEVTGESKYEPLIESYIRRELRALRDVEEVGVHPDIVSTIITTEAAKIGNASSCAYSCLVTRPFNPRNYAMLFENSPRHFMFFTNIIHEAVIVEHYMVGFAPDPKLKESMEELITTIDSRVFERDRRSFRQIQDAFIKSRNGKAAVPSTSPPERR